MKVFTELTPECDITAQMYAAGYEKGDCRIEASCSKYDK